MLAMGRNCKQPELAARFINFLLTDPQAAAILGKTRGVPAARVPLELLVQSNRLPSMELAAHKQISAQRIAGRVPVPAPLFEHARLHKFMREVFETIAYGKISEREAVRRLVDDGNALLKRIK
jgi:oligogalacturonide transport system substrate-binding protein